MNTTDKSNLYIGWATDDITPEGPVSLYGQYYERISTYVQSPLTVTACALESLSDRGDKEQAVMVSMDIIHIPAALQQAVQQALAQRLPELDATKVFLNATHTHSGPLPDPASEYGRFAFEKIVQCIVRAWQNRQPSGVSAVLGYAVVGHNRRALYGNGTAEMYGDCTREDFTGIEGPSDPSVDMLFCWDGASQLKGVVLNVSCPAQVTEAKYFVSADYWGEVRAQLKQRLGKDVFVLPQCSAAGDVSPRDLTTNYKAGEPNMWDVDGTIEIGRRLVDVLENACSSAGAHIEWQPVFKHVVKQMELPLRQVSEEEYRKAKFIVEKIRSGEPDDPDSPQTAWNRFLREIEENEKVKAYGPWDSKTSDFGWLKPLELVLQQYEEQAGASPYTFEMHVIRLGNIAFASNPFELFVDFGFALTARSKAKQTFMVQLACDYGGYLATQRALDAGGYSAMANTVGAEAGWLLVNETVHQINQMWE